MFNIKVILPASTGKQYNGPVIQTHYPSTTSLAFDWSQVPTMGELVLKGLPGMGHLTIQSNTKNYQFNLVLFKSELSKVACATAPTPKIHDGLTVFQSSMVWVVWDKRAKNVQKKPSDVRSCYFYNKTDSIFVSIQGKSLFSMNSPCKNLCEFVFVETIALLLTMCESIC